MADAASDQLVAKQAAQWVMRLTCDDEEERIRACDGFSAWKAADPRHQQAAARIEALIDRVQGVRQEAGHDLRPVHAALKAAHNQSRQRQPHLAKRVGVTLALMLAIALPSWYVLDIPQPMHLLADVRNAQGQWMTRTLEDGTRITMSGASAINLRYDAQTRTVELLEGDILVDVAKDAARPFYVKTPNVLIRALGTRFSVTHDKNGSILEMFESKVSVQTIAKDKNTVASGLVVSAGQRVRLSAQGVDRIEEMDAARVEDSWQRHQLVIKDRPLNEVLEQLMRHRDGSIHYDAKQLEHLRVSGVLPLNDTDQALSLLQANFPELRVRRVASRWVWVDLKKNTPG